MNILHLEDSDVDHQIICRALVRDQLPFTISRVERFEDFLREANSNKFEVILADYKLAGFTALNAWDAIANNSIRPIFILVSGTIGETAAVSAIQMGVSDYVHKDDVARLGRVILRAIELERLRVEKEAADSELMQSQQQLAAFADHLQTTIENERAAIAREIHDDIGGSLAAANLDLSWISRNAADFDVQHHAQAATQMILHAMGASQRIMLNLRPSVLDQGLLPAIQWLASNFEVRNDARVNISTSSNTINPPKFIALVAYRTTQEALTNCSKHAICKTVSIDISDVEDVLTVEIRDDGRGIGSEDMQKEKAFGLRGLRERARSAGGWLDVSSELGRGTSIILSVPLAQTDRSETREAGN
jgi:signal transduction histidine kinase